ncbi:MAG TPA: alpha/beta hydrolase [Rhizomicrobium sp.]|nr:alpha/beta hydrolase [Rhizomicrobium sp.]
MRAILPIFLLLISALPATAQDGPVYGPRLEGFDYPHPVQIFRFTSQKMPMEMAYMDVKPAKPGASAKAGATNKEVRTVVLLHGKNFCAATWEGTIAALTGAGYRVIAPDQIGFCKSTKPQHYQYTFEQLAANTRALLLSLNLNRVTVMGHSMGGMLATRFALTFPEMTEQLVSVNPLGLEDGRAKGVPWSSVDENYKGALGTTAASAREYQRTVYYAGTWKPEYDKWVEMQAGMYRGAGKEIMAWNSALTSEMIATQPVIHELERLKMPVLFLIGDKDITGRSNRAPKEVQATLGNFPAMSEAAKARIPTAKLVRFADMGHSPQIQDPVRFHKALLDGLANP